MDDYIPDIMERGEDRCDAWYFDNVKDGVATCSCGGTFDVDKGETLSSDPYAIPVCPACFEKAVREKHGDAAWERAFPCCEFCGKPISNNKFCSYSCQQNKRKETTMKIQGKTLEESDVGRRVRYVPTHANGDLSHKDVEDGLITSWNEVNVFVDYGHCSHPATSPEDLIWG